MGHTLSFGQLLKHYRKAAGLTQEELAEQARLSVRGIQALEQGVSHTPRLDTVALLAAALGLSPQAEATFAAAARLRSFPPAGPSSSGGPRGAGSHAVVPLVGRTRELAVLERHLRAEQTAEGTPRVLLLAGEPGIGKSRLLQEAVQQGVAQGLTVLAGGCHRQGSQEPYAPLLDALAQHLHAQAPGRLRTALVGCAWLVRLLPELAETLEPLSPGTLPPEQERRLMFAAVARLLANVAGPAGTLLVLDDLQWAGPDALDLLAMLVRTATVPLRVVGAYRDTEVRPAHPLGLLLADLAQAGLARQCAVGPLSAEEAAGLLDNLLGGVAEEDRAMAESVLQRAGGMPFFLISYAQARQQGSAEAVPWDLAQGVRQRVALLPAAGREILGAAAIVGRRVPRALLMAMAGQAEEEVLAGLEAACRARLLREDGDNAYVFAHDVIREVVEADGGAAQRAALHGRAAEVLEQEPGAPVEVLAYHYSRSNAPDKAALYLERAGDHAWAQHATAAAQDSYQEVVARLDRLGRPRDAARVREKLGTVLTTAARYDAALAVLEQAAEQYRATGQPEGAVRAIALIGERHFLRGTYAEGLGRLRTLLEALEGSAPSPGLVASYTTLALLLLITGRFDEELAAAERAVDLAHRVGDERLLIPAEQGRAQALLVLSRPALALPLLEDVIRRAETAGDLVSLYRALMNMAGVCFLRGEFAREQQYIDRARAATERLGDPEAQAFVLESAGWAAWFQGEWTAAREAHERVLALIRAIGPCRLTATAHIIAGVWRYWAGAWADATRCLEEGIASAERSSDLQTLPVAHWILAEMDLLDGRPNAARARLEPLLARPALQESVVTGLPSTLLLRTTLAWAHLERGAAAEAAAATSLTIARATALGYRLPLVDAWRIQGMVCTREGRWDEARRAFADGLALARSLPYPYAEARLLHMNGLLHLQMGEPAPAWAQLEAARALFARLGARTNAVQVEQDLAGLSQKQGLIEMRLTDVQWAQIEVLLPPRPRRRGRPRADDRRTLEAILYVRRTGCAWAALPAELGDEATAHRRWQEWQAAGLWERIAAVLQAPPPGVKGHERTAGTGAYTPPASSPLPSRARSGDY